MKSLTVLINELENKLPFIGQKKESVSQVTVGWHLEHSLLALIKMISAVEHSNPSDYKWKFSLKRAVVFMTGTFPRGRGKAPDAVRPGEVITMTNITGLIEKAKQKAELFEKLSPNNFFKHPVFGDLQLKHARRIIAIHTWHHIKIIHEIISG